MCKAIELAALHRRESEWFQTVAGRPPRSIAMVFGHRRRPIGRFRERSRTPAR